MFNMRLTPMFLIKNEVNITRHTEHGLINNQRMIAIRRQLNTGPIEVIQHTPRDLVL